MPVWDPYLSERDREHLNIWGKKEPFGFGVRPVLLIVDDYYSVVGVEREPILESIKNWPGSCGLEGWEAIDRTTDLIAAARANDIPIIYTIDDLTGYTKPWGRRGRPRHQLDHLPQEIQAKANEIVAEIAPQLGDLVISKAAPSGFQGTSLLFHLNYMGVDTIITCGETTSGCVRASVVDGCTFRYRMGVVAECCFDRTEASHAINLFDMHQKYADVIDLEAAQAYFAAVGGRMPVAAGR